jgi:hypothetical protein
MVRFIVFSNRMAARMCSEVKAGLVMMRVLIAVDEIKHLLLAGVLALRNPIMKQRLRGAAAALIEGRDKALSRGILFICSIFIH